jgi:peptidoglycan/xylan/chitin deacetylase (PgdA/CDA1 family)
VVLTTSAASLNTGWLVPAGHVKVDYKTLAKPSMKICALTFDDGPDGKYTPQVAAILNHYQVHATFFVIGRRTTANPQVLKALVAAGFEIGNHTADHAHMPRLSADRQRGQIKSLQDTLGELGVTPRWFRPPYGDFNASTVATASRLGLETVLWSVDPRDWSEPGVSRIQSRVLSAVKPGAVILLHSTHGQTVEALPGIIESLQKDGYRFVTMSEWAQAVSGKLPALSPVDDVLPASNAGAPPPGLQIEPEEAVELPGELSFRSTGASPAETTSALALAGPAPASPAHLATEPPAAPQAAAPTGTAQPVSAGMEGEADNAALLVHANFDAPAQAEKILRGAPGGRLQHWASQLDRYGSVRGYLAQLNPQLYSRPMPVPEALAEPLPGPAVYPLSGAGAFGGDWQPGGPLDLGSVVAGEQELRDNRFRPAPKYYLLGIGAYTDAETWEGLDSFYRLARLDGLLVSDQAAYGLLSDAAPAPHLLAPAAQLSSGAMVDLSLQSLSDVLESLEQGHGNVYLTMRPGSIASYSGSTLGELGSSQQEFVLFRRLTAGLNYDAAPQNDFATGWPLPPGIRLARFFDPGREVLVLYSPEGSRVAFNLPTASRGYNVAQLDDEGRLVIRPIVETTQVLGRKVLLLTRELH